jgi:hypothetical protein
MVNNHYRLCSKASLQASVLAKSSVQNSASRIGNKGKCSLSKVILKAK